MDNQFKRGSFEDQYWHLAESAQNKIVEIVKAYGGRITLSGIPDSWDEDGSKVADDVIENSISLRIDNGNGTIAMYPIDFFDNNGYVNVLFIDDYGDNPRIYADNMDNLTVLQLADFLVRSFPDIQQVNSGNAGNCRYIVIEKHGGPEYASIVTNEDGKIKIFETEDEAEKEADDCQDGLFVRFD